MERSLLDIIRFNDWVYYDGWPNGKKGAICCHPDEEWIFRFYEPLPDINGWWDYHHKPKNEFPIVCVGIAGCWFANRSKLNVRQIYDYYTNIRYEQYKDGHKEDFQKWEWEEHDWKRAFYCDYIIPHETELNKMSEPLFDYITGNDAKTARGIIDCYMEYLKKKRNTYRPPVVKPKSKEKPEIVRVVDIEKILSHFNRNFDRITHASTFKMLLEQPDSDKNLARVAYLIYKSQWFIKSDYSTFSKWYKDFCHIVGCEFHNSYEPCKLKPIDEDLKNKYYFIL